LLLAQSVLLTLLLPVLPLPDSPLLPARRPLLFPTLRGVGSRPGSGRRWVRPRGVHCHSLLKTTIKTTPVCHKRPRGEVKPTHCWTVGEHDEQPEVVMPVRHGLEVDGAPRLRRCVFPRETIMQQP
jgi:hypothetical protein